MTTSGQRAINIKSLHHVYGAYLKALPSRFPFTRSQVYVLYRTFLFNNPSLVHLGLLCPLRIIEPLHTG
jgi:hypothetical protein